MVTGHFQEKMSWHLISTALNTTTLNVTLCGSVLDTAYVTVFANHLAHFIIIEISTVLYNGFQADSTSFSIETKLWALKMYVGIMVKVLASLHSGNSTFAPSGWFMHARSHIYSGHAITKL